MTDFSNADPALTGNGSSNFGSVAVGSSEWVGSPGVAGVSEQDLDEIRELIGREPRGWFRVVVRDDTGAAMVIQNHPLLDDGTPMPTSYWLVDRELNKRIGTIEAEGGVKAAEAGVDPTSLTDAHNRYAKERDSRIPDGWAGPRPSGGVGGTRQGVKCLHTHYAWYLAGGDDPVGRWVHARLHPETGTGDEDGK